MSGLPDYKPLTAYRPMRPEDHQFVRSGWAASLRNSIHMPLIPMANWADVMHPIIDHHLRLADVLVAEGTETGVLKGFIAYKSGRYQNEWPRGIVTMDGYVWYVYVAAPFRRGRIARGLFTAAGIDPNGRFGYAVMTRSSWYCKDKISRASYDPLHARFMEPIVSNDNVEVK